MRYILHMMDNFGTLNQSMMHLRTIEYTSFVRDFEH
jgi:hypothetical protein